VLIGVQPFALLLLLELLPLLLLPLWAATCVLVLLWALLELILLLLLDDSNVATGPDTVSGGDGLTFFAGALWQTPWPEALNSGSEA
jgi:hypothetical protein